MRFFWLAPIVVLALAGCGHGPAPQAADTPQGQCAAAADQDPDVKAAEQKQIIMTLNSQQGGSSVAAIRQQKIDACLRARGLGPPGGVEKVR
jgi:hypothetical protein